MKKIAIASDHGGYDLKNQLIKFIKQLSYEVDDMGPTNNDSVDYPDYGSTLAKVVGEGKISRGIVI